MKISVVIGAGFGDEGKGKVTNFLAKQSPKSLVIRFNGGQQAGHTVVENGVRHVFSSFGSGTLVGAPTFISKYCTIFPPAILMEYTELVKKGVSPEIYVDPLAMVTTPFDIALNRYEEGLYGHGSCGSGFGKTVERHETLEHSHRIFAKDLSHPWILKQKLEMLSQKIGNSYQDLDISDYLEKCREVSYLIKLIPFYNMISSQGFNNLVFEGAQGILLDREHGIFPHVTRSSTTSKNVLKMLSSFDVKSAININYLTRCYATRHGNGPLAGEGFEINLTNNENETNITNAWQGKFRVAPLSLDLLKYAIMSDFCYHGKQEVSPQVIISHLDQLEQIPLYMNSINSLYKVESEEKLVKIANNVLQMPVKTSKSETL